LIVLQGVHQEVPGGEAGSPAYSILPAPTETAAQTPEGAPQPDAQATDADRLRAIYKDVGVQQKHTYGEGPPGSKPPDFTKIPSIHGVPQPGMSQPAGLPGPAGAAPASAGPTGAPPKPSAPVVAKPKPQPPASLESTDDEPVSVDQRKVAPPAAKAPVVKPPVIKTPAINQ